MTIRALSMGWGAQSWFLAVASVRGFIPPYDLIIHSDTGYEAQSTYDFVSQWGGWLAERSNYVGLRRDLDFSDYHDLPLHSERGGLLRRQCTGNWKIEPMRRYVRGLCVERGLSVYVGKKRGGVASVHLDLGISTDEFERMRVSDVGYIDNHYPLVDMNLSRQECIALLLDWGFPVPGKSSCYFCPYHSRSTWRAGALSRGQDFKKAVEVDNQIRDIALPGRVYLHRDCVPLDRLLSVPVQLDLLGDLGQCDGGYCWA